MPLIKNGIIISMNMLSSFLVAAGLCMDNFAVTIAAGCSQRTRFSRRNILFISSSFALAHVIMFSAGWLGGWELGQRMNRWDHWIAFFLLAFVGVKMIKEAFEEEHEPQLETRLSWRHLVIATATSLDALGVGVALSLENAPFWTTLVFMAVCVFLTSCAGFWLGRLLGKKFGTIMEVAGGLVLVGLGVKILLSGLGIW